MTKQEFRAKHIPELRVLCNGLGLPLAWRNMAFSEASDHVMAAALKRGASGLSDAALADLERWISQTLTAAVAMHAPAADAYFAACVKWDAKRDAWWAERERIEAAQTDRMAA